MNPEQNIWTDPWFLDDGWWRTRRIILAILTTVLLLAGLSRVFTTGSWLPLAQGLILVFFAWIAPVGLRSGLAIQIKAEQWMEHHLAPGQHELLHSWLEFKRGMFRVVGTLFDGFSFFASIAVGVIAVGVAAFGPVF